MLSILCNCYISKYNWLALFSNIIEIIYIQNIQVIKNNTRLTLKCHGGMTKMTCNLPHGQIISNNGSRYFTNWWNIGGNLQLMTQNHLTMWTYIYTFFFIIFHVFSIINSSWVHKPYFKGLLIELCQIETTSSSYTSDLLCHAALMLHFLFIFLWSVIDPEIQAYD